MKKDLNQKVNAQPRKFGIRDKLAYAAGDAGCNLSFGLKGTVQTFWLVFMVMETPLYLCLYPANLYLNRSRITPNGIPYHSPKI